jgi:hypothetical protein
VIVYVCGNDLCKINPAGGPAVPLTTDGTAAAPYRRPSLSRDGTKLAFLHGPTGSTQSVDGIYVADANAANRRGPFKNQGADTTPPASLLVMKPDGSRVAYTHIYTTYNTSTYQNEVHSDLESFASDGSDQQWIECCSYSVGFGADGSYLGTDNRATTSDAVAICLLSPPSGPRTNDARCVRYVAADPARDLFQSSVSPDGSVIVAESCAKGNCSSDSRIESFTYATGAPRGFLTAGPTDGDPAFSPAGDRVVFSRGKDLYTIAAAGPAGSEAKLVSGGSAPTWAQAPGGSGSPGPTLPTPAPKPGTLPGPTPGAAPGARRGACAGLKGQANARCQAKLRLERGLKACSSKKGKKRTKCVKKATVAYHRDLARIACQTIKKPGKLKSCLARARKIRK